MVKKRYWSKTILNLQSKLYPQDEEVRCLLKTVNYDSGNEEHIKQLSSCTRTWRTKSRTSTRRRWPSYSPAATSPPRHYSVHVHTKTASIRPFEELCDFGDVAHKLGALTFVDEANAVGLNGKGGREYPGEDRHHPRDHGSDRRLSHPILEADRLGLQLWSRSFKAN